jgi:tetratricopeptide (TPR) repeat protein
MNNFCLILGKAVMIMLDYISTVETFKSLLLSEKFKFNEKNLIEYKTDADSHFLKENIQKGQLILATNIAGRGTDIKLTDSVYNNGGLHLCLTHLPVNERIENQNFGRTARSGNPGSVQMIIFDSSDKSVDELKSERTKRNQIQYSKMTEKVNQLLLKRSVFENISINETNLEEKFGQWLKMFKWQNVSFDEAQESFSKYLQENSKFENFFHQIVVAKDFYEKSDYDSAVKECDKIINENENLAENAYILRGLCNIKKYGHDASSNQSNIKRTIEDFKRARSLISLRDKELRTISAAANSDTCDLVSQIEKKLTLYNIQTESINAAIGYEQEKIDEFIKQLEERMKKLQKKFEDRAPDFTKEMFDEDMKDLEDELKKAREMKDYKGTIREILDKKESIKIVQVGLKNDLGDQVDAFRHEIIEFEENGYIAGYKLKADPPLFTKVSI